MWMILILSMGFLSMEAGDGPPAGPAVYAAVTVNDRFVAQPEIELSYSKQSTVFVRDQNGVNRRLAVSFVEPASQHLFARVELIGEQTRLTPLVRYPDAAETRFRTGDGTEISLLLSLAGT